MAILCSTIVNQLNALLDSEGSDRYLWDQDFLPAITYANQNLVAILNKAFAENKLSEESLRDLTFTRIWQTSTYSRFAFDSTVVGRNLWSILAIHPEITYAGSWSATTSNEGIYQPALKFKKSSFSAKRLTAEEWTEKERNMFIPGSPLITCDYMKEYAFLNPFDYYSTGVSFTNSRVEIEIAPDYPNKLIAMRYLAVPTTPTVISSSLDFPVELTDVIVQLSLKFIGIKQGEVPTFQVTDKEVKELTALIS